MIDLSGYDSIVQLDRGELLADRRGIGLLAYDVALPGPGIGPETAIPVRSLVAPRLLSEILTWIDLWPRSVIPASDTGGDWRWSGSVWSIDRDFAYIREQGSAATPVATSPAIVAGFNAFAPALTPALGFWQGAARFRGSIDIERTSGITGTTAKTDLQIGGVSIVSVAWPNNVVVQHIEFDFWLSGATVITSVVTATYATGTPPSVAGQTAPADFTVANLDTIAQGIQVGITDPGAHASVYKLFSIEVIALA